MKIDIGSRKMNMRTVASYTGGRLVGSGERAFRFAATDSREADADTMFVALRGERTDGNSYIGAMPGVSCFLAERLPDNFDAQNSYAVVVPDTGNALLTLGEMYRRQLKDLRVYGVTGSVGKTTEKEMLSAVLAEKYKSLYKTDGNHNSIIGLPMTLLSLSEKNDAAVLEMGMSARGEISRMSVAARPNVAIITNIGTSHMEMLGSRENICRAKCEIADGMADGSLLLLNGDEPLLRAAMPTFANLRTLTFGFGEGNDYMASNIRFTEDRTYFDLVSGNQQIADLSVYGIGKHLVMSALAAAAVALEEGMDAEAIRRGLASYRSVNMRQQILTAGKRTVISDCYNASPESMSAAASVMGELRNMTGKVAGALLGDMLELGATSDALHEETGYRMAKCGAVCLSAIGQYADAYRRGAIRGGMKEENIRVFASRDEFAEATAFLCGVLPENGILLVKGSRGMRLERAVEYLSESVREH